MDRYSYVYGTLEDGMYSRMDGSEDLGAFFAQIKAVNPTITEDIVRNILGGLKKLDGYEGASYYDAPLAVRYAPMHLYKRPDMPNDMDAFCSLCITGAEQREGRDTYFNQVFFVSREEMQMGTTENGRKINYMDQIFGFEWLTAKEMDGHRSKKYPVDFDAVPHAVEPKLCPQDLALILQTVRSIYDEKCVIIRLEKNCSFNKRAKQLLIQIYSMMQPRLATEIGFASYQDPAGIQAMARQTSIRIYLVPAESKIPELADDSFVIFDLNEPKSIPGLVRDEMNETLHKWSMMPWSQRQEEMAALFQDTVMNYMDKQLFLDRSRDFFNNEFFTWAKETPNNIKAESLEELSELYSRFPILEQSSRAKTMFLKKLNSSSLKQLAAQAFAVGLLGENEEQKQSQQQMYLFAAEKLNGADPLAMGVASGRLAQKQTEEKAKQQMDIAKQAHAREITDLKASSAAAIAAEEAKTMEAKVAGAAALAAEKEASANKMANIQAAHEAAIAEEKQNTENVKTAAMQAIQAEKQRTEEANVRANALDAQLTAETNAHTQTRMKLETESSARAQSDAQLAASQQENENLNGRLQVAAKKFQELKQQKLESDHAAAVAKEEAAAVVNRLANDRKKVEMDLAMAASKMREANDAANRVIREQERIKNDRKKTMSIGIGIGFGIGAVLFGIIFAVILLTGKKNEPVYVPTEPMPTVQTEAVEATVPETTVPEETEAAARNVDLASMLVDEVPEIVAVETVGLEAYAVSDAYAPVAVLWMDEDRASDNFAVLMQKADQTADETVPMETMAQEVQSDSGEILDEQAAATEAALAEDGAEEVVGATELMVEMTVEDESVMLPAARLVMTSGDLRLIVYGDDITVEGAIKAFALLEDAEIGTQAIWYAGDVALPMNALLQMKGYAWEDVDFVEKVTSEPSFAEDLQPVVRIDCNKEIDGEAYAETLYVFALPSDSDVEIIQLLLEENGFDCVQSDGYIVATAKNAG